MKVVYYYYVRVCVLYVMIVLGKSEEDGLLCKRETNDFCARF